MYNIKYSLLAERRIEDFYLYRKYYYREKFFDTGMLNEDEIYNICLENLKSWHRDLFSLIETKLESGFLGQIESQNDKYEQRKIVLSFGNYILTLIVKQWLNEKVITIEDIIIRT